MGRPGRTHAAVAGCLDGSERTGPAHESRGCWESRAWERPRWRMPRRNGWAAKSTSCRPRSTRAPRICWSRRSSKGEGSLRYVASPLVTAMLRGGIAILDEGNRMSEKSWASLAPLLDNRRYVESIVAGIKIKAHPQFRLVATMNDDASTFELPEYIHSRLQPQIFIDFPERDEEYHILQRESPLRRRADPDLRHRFPAIGPRRRRALHGARRHQCGAVCHEAEEPGHPAHARNRSAGNRHRAGSG